jgi:4-amino-4-deoxy-L-arabinose transferase-like glycosyltransferase
VTSSSLDIATQPESPVVSSSRPLAWATWSRALLLIAIVLIVRIVYLAWFCPVELIGDESYYWQQARHLDWCYDEKGPLLAWMMAPCLWLLGSSVLSVRLPMVIASAVAAWGVGKLALDVYRDERVAFFAVLTFCLIPAFQANAQICTQDGPLIVVWLALTAVTLRLLRHWHADQNTWGDWMLFWLVMGIGILLKQSMPLFLACGAVYLLLQRKHLKWRWGQLIGQQLAGGIVALIVISPMIIWNAHHRWPMLEHTLGHLGAGGDQAGHVDSGNALTWSMSVIGGFVGAMGPAFVALAVWALIRTWRGRSVVGSASADRLFDRDRSNPGSNPSAEADPTPRTGTDELWLHCSAWPALGFFLLLSLTKPVIPSWPLPSFVALCVPVAALVVAKLPAYLDLMTQWRARRAAGEKIKKPDTALHRWWWTLCAYGIGGWLIISFPTALGHLPLVKPKLTRSILDRITGHRAEAMELSKTLAQLHDARALDPIVVTRHYMAAGLYSFYLPGHPTIRTAGKFLGKRATTYSQWTDTRMDNPALYGKTLLLVELGEVPWDKALKFDTMQPLPGGKFFLASNYQGPRPDHPQFVKGLDR